MLVISDTSAITNLIQVEKLDLLAKLFGEIIIPAGVYDELAVYEQQQAEIDTRSWILVQEELDRSSVETLARRVDQGEAEAIVLAGEKGADLLGIDERKGRLVAEELRIKIIGLMGILARGKKKGHLPALKPVLDRLIQEVGFRVSPPLYAKILSEAGEG